MNYKTNDYANRLIHLADYASHMKLSLVNDKEPYFLIESIDNKNYYYFVVPDDLDLTNVIIPLYSWYILSGNRQLIAIPKTKAYARDLLRLQKAGKVQKLDINKDHIIL